ncbi:MAG: hypothetical protein ABSC03_02385 [Verrucomicrobiota bacterium]|jgi:hypothetical protein
MNCLDRNSLGSTLDSISESLFFEHPIPESQRVVAARWIAARQGLPGSYAGMFAPTEKDTLGIHLFTGEAIRSRARIAHILGEEGCRILTRLHVTDGQVQDSLNRAVRGMAARLAEAERRGYDTGTYCCGTCSAAYWRNLAINLLPRAEERLRLGLKELKNSRSGAGKWRRFPFHYTCLALTEIGPELAKSEMRYAAWYWRNNLKKLASAESSVARRRAAVGQRLLELCE